MTLTLSVGRMSSPSQVSEDDEGNKRYTTIIKAATQDSFDKLNRFCLDDQEIDDLLKVSPPQQQAQAGIVV